MGNTNKLEIDVNGARTSLAGLDRQGLADALGHIGVPERQRRMRVAQLWGWLYVRGVTRFDDMSDVSKELRSCIQKPRAACRWRRGAALWRCTIGPTATQWKAKWRA